MTKEEPIPSKKPYLLRAIYEWCTDSGYTPHIAVRLDARTRVPRQFMHHSEVVLNISFEATHQLQMGNDWLEFNARFSSRSCKISIPIDNVLAIYAYENGQGMAFQLEETPSPSPSMHPDGLDSQDKPALEILAGQSGGGDFDKKDDISKGAGESEESQEGAVPDLDLAADQHAAENEDSRPPPKGGRGRAGHLRLVK